MSLHRPVMAKGLMQALFLLLWLVLLPPAHAAAPVNDEATQRLLIESERGQIEFAFESRLRECQARFAVTTCVEAAQATRRDKVHTLRQQEEVLDSNERRRRAAQRLEVIREKTEAQTRAKPPARAGSAAPGATPPIVDGGFVAPAVPNPATSTPAVAPAARGSRLPAAGRAESDKAAADRAAATRQRRDAALRRQQQRETATPGKAPAAPLPAAPAAASAPSPLR